MTDRDTNQAHTLRELLYECARGDHTRCPTRVWANDHKTQDLNRRFPYAGVQVRCYCTCPCHKLGADELHRWQKEFPDI